MKKILFIAFSTLLFQNANAQDEQDLLRLSSAEGSGTARSLGTAGAQGSIGGDFSAVGVNPAGLGKYSKSEFVFTPSFKQFSTTSTFEGSSNKENGSKTAIENLSLIVTRNNRDQRNNKSARTTSFGFGFNKIADYNSDYGYGAKNIKSSIVNAHIENLNNYGGAADLTNQSATPQQFLAYQTGLIGIVGNNLVSNVPSTSGIYQGKQVSTTGATNELSAVIASNFKERFLFGASLGIPMIKYNRITQYKEENQNNLSSNFVSSIATENLSVSGSGINFKLGGIFLLNQFRIGAAFHSPTNYVLTDAVSFDQSATYNNGIRQESADSAPFRYDVNTPSKAIISGSYIIKNRGFISLDLDRINYSAAKLKLAEADFKAYENAVNNVASNIYKVANNIRLGVEYKIKDISLRGGYASQGSPFTSTNRLKDATQSIGGGIGYRANSFFVDAGYRVSLNKNKVYNFVTEQLNQPLATINNSNNNLLFSVGWKF
jgi:hypothetical protein